MKNAPLLVATLIAGASLTAGAGIDVAKLPPAAAKKDVTYAKDIKPLFDASCIRCHGTERPKAGLRLDTLEAVLKGSKEGPVVVKGDGAKSILVAAISQLDPETAMPPKPRAGRGGPGGPGGPGGRKREGGPGGWAGPHGTNAPAGGPGGGGGNFQPPKPLTPDQVGLVRAWIDQGPK